MKFSSNSSSTVLILLVVLGVDFLLATQLASDSNEVWTWFLILMIVPLVFAIKAAVIRLVMWKFYLKKISVDYYLNLFQKQKWPRWGFCSDAEDYLTDVIEDSNENIDIRITASKIYGEIRSNAENQRLVSYLLMNSAIKKAAQLHDKSIYNPNRGCES
jgi:hypothetical protein